MKTLRELFNEVVAEDNSPAKCENQAMALRRYAEQNLGVTDQDALHAFFDQSYELLNDGTAFDETAAAADVREEAPESHTN